MGARLIPPLAARATDQHGLLSLADLAEHGVSRAGRRQLVATGRLELVARNVFGVVGTPISLERDLQLGLLCLGPGALVSHEAAGRLHRFDRCHPTAVEFTVDRTRRNATCPFRVHSTAVLTPIDRVTLNGFACTSATRTIIDLARLRIHPVRLEAAIDSAVRSGASSPITLATRLSELRGRGRWGVRLLDELLVDSGGHTLLERRFLTLVREAGLPRPRAQVVHRRDGRTFARVDFLFEDHNVVIEVGGQHGHASDADRSRDAQRRNELREDGRTVVEFTWRDVTQRPSYVLTTLHLHLH